MCVLLALAIVLACLLAGVRLFGLSPYVVLSGSMEPEYKKDSLIYVKKVDYTQLHPGDVITFMLNDEKSIVTHRIKKVVEAPTEDDPKALKFQTQGDGNKRPDQSMEALLHYRNIIGRPVFAIPKLGSFYEKMKDNLAVTLIIAGILIVMLFLPDMVSAAEKHKKKREDAITALAAKMALSGQIPQQEDKTPPPDGSFDDGADKSGGA